VDVLLGDVHSLKEKRSLVRPVVAELRRRFPVSAAEVDHHELHRRVTVGVSLVASDREFCVDVLDGCERLFEERPELEIHDLQRRLFTDEDLEDLGGSDRRSGGWRS
jgi:uncharacterized protein